MGKIIVDAAAQAGVQHFIFSSGPNCTELTGGKVRMKAMNSEFYMSFSNSRCTSKRKANNGYGQTNTALNSIYEAKKNSLLFPSLARLGTWRISL